MEDQTKGIITYDWKETLELAEEIMELNNKHFRYFYMVETNSDEYSVVWSFNKLTQEEAQEYYDNYIESLE